MPDRTHSLLETSQPVTVLRRFGVRYNERGRTLLFFLTLFLASGVFTLGRTVRDTLFLSRYDTSWLPWMFVAYGVVAAVVAALYRPLAERFRLDRLIQLSAVLCAASYVGAWFAIRQERAWIYPTFYVWAEVSANLLILQAWSYAVQAHTVQEAKRLFGVIGSGRVLAIIVCGAGIGALVGTIGTANLLFVMVALVLALGVVSAWIHRAYMPKRRSVQKPKILPEDVERAGRFTRSGYLMVLAALVCVTFVTCTLADYQFKMIVSGHFHENDLAAFFGAFYAVTGLVSFVVQLAGTPRLLTRLGIVAGLLVMPVMLLGSSIALLAWPVVWMAALLKFSDNAFQYSVNDSALQIAYFPIPEEVRERVRTVLDGAIKPLSYGLGGLALVFVAKRMEVVSIGWIVLGLIVAWIVLVLVLRKKYLAALLQSLKRPTPVDSGDWAEDLPMMRETLRSILATGGEKQILFALDKLGPRPDPALLPHLVGLCKNQNPHIRAAAANQLGYYSGDSQACSLVTKLIEDDHHLVRGWACRALCRMPGGIDQALSLLPNDNLRVHDMALRGIRHHGGPEEVELADWFLDGMFHHGNADERVRLARIIEDFPMPGDEARVHRLIEDEAVEVRRAGLIAASKIGSSTFLSIGLKMIRDRKTARESKRLLARIGSPAVDSIRELLFMDSVSLRVKRRLIGVLVRIGGRDAVAVLKEHLDEPSEHLRNRIWRALARLGRHGEHLHFSEEQLENILHTEMERYLAYLDERHRAWEELGDILLDEAIEHRLNRAVVRLLRILEIKYKNPSIYAIGNNLYHPRPEIGANAAEALEQLLDPPENQWVRLLLASESSKRKLRIGRALGFKARGAEDAIGRLLNANSRWVKVCCLHALGQAGKVEREPDVRARLEHPSPMVRDAALIALADMERLDEGTLKIMMQDPDPVIAARARELSEKSEDTMHLESRLERVLFLRKVPILENVSGDDLLTLATAVKPVVLESGRRLVNAGDPADAMWIVVEGELEVSLDGVEISRVGADGMVGEMSLLDGSPHDYDISAVTDSELLRISRDDFFEVLAETPPLIQAIFKTLNDRLRKADRRLVEAMEVKK